MKARALSTAVVAAAVSLATLPALALAQAPAWRRYIQACFALPS